MKFKEVKLYTNKLSEELAFYTIALGFELIQQAPNSFTVRIGSSQLTFERSEQEHAYHYCFLIPANKLSEALSWFEGRTAVIKIEDGQKTVHFASWNADSFYFYDASGNVAECIVRYDLKNEVNGDFDGNQVLCVNELGLPTRHIEGTNSQLKHEMGTDYWKGDKVRFGTNGNQEGIFLMPNYTIKDVWFPTSIKITPEPFECIIESNGICYAVAFKNEVLRIAIIGTDVKRQGKL